MSLSSVRKLLILPELPSVDVLWASFFASVTSSISVMFLGVEYIQTVVTGIMWAVMLVMMTGDLLTNYYAMDVEDRPSFDLKHEMTGKLLLISLVVLSFVLDLVIYLIATYLPGDFPLLTSGFTFIGLTSLLWMIAGHGIRIVNNVAKHKSIDQLLIPPSLSIMAEHIQWVLKNLRRIDKRRAEVTHAEIHDERWIDNLTDAEVDQLVAVMLGRRKKLPEKILPSEEEES